MIGGPRGGNLDDFYAGVAGDLDQDELLKLGECEEVLRATFDRNRWVEEEISTKMSYWTLLECGERFGGTAGSRRGS